MAAESDSRGASSGALVAADWLAACRRMVEEQREVFFAAPSIAERTVYDGIGEGGDRALEIDRRCEDIVFRELEAMHADGTPSRRYPRSEAMSASTPTSPICAWSSIRSTAR